MNGDLIGSIHPGEILREDFLLPMGISAQDLAEKTGIPGADLDAILNGQARITPDAAQGLARAFGASASLWIGLQARYDRETTGVPPSTRP